MLEEYALTLAGKSEAELMFMGFGLIVLGFLFGLAKRSGATLSLRRVPYFIGSSAVFAFVSALPLAWLLTFEAMQDGLFWALCAFIFGGIFVGGVLTGVLGHARSLNAFGTASYAWMAIIPIVNFVLLFKRPQDWGRGGGAGGVASFLGVVFGLFLLIIGAGIGQFAERKMEQMTLAAESDPELQSISAEAMLKGLGLEETLRQLASEVPRQRIDESTVLVKVDSVREKLRYFYEVSDDIPRIPETHLKGIIEQNCNFSPLRILFQQGAVIQHIYLNSAGSEIARVDVTSRDCAL